MEIVEASIIDGFKTLFIIIGVLVVMRFIGKLMIIKRMKAEERHRESKKRSFENGKKESLRNKGKVSIDYSKSGRGEFVEFEEIE